MIYKKKPVGKEEIEKHLESRRIDRMVKKITRKFTRREVSTLKFCINITIQKYRTNLDVELTESEMKDYEDGLKEYEELLEKVRKM